jgi:hypothetical protein
MGRYVIHKHIISAAGTREWGLASPCVHVGLGWAEGVGLHDGGEGASPEGCDGGGVRKGGCQPAQVPSRWSIKVRTDLFQQARVEPCRHMHPLSGTAGWGTYTDTPAVVAAAAAAGEAAATAAKPLCRCQQNSQHQQDPTAAAAAAAAG